MRIVEDATVSIFSPGATKFGYSSLVSDEPSVSRVHAALRLVPGGIEVSDLGSSRGTFVNGQRVVAPQLVKPTDDLRIGDLAVKIEPFADSSVCATVQISRSALDERIRGMRPQEETFG